MSQENSNAFDPENFQTVLLIQMMRTYDILLALLAVQDPVKATQLADMHEKGLTFTPHPAFSVEEDAEETN
ncbi:hypothetical protein SEA_SHAM_3 [Streptomyces phage Sham]|nr:hypothetical protein SEA_SHAM_3 [Streptomyces phage Sham]